ncbi:MAG: GNAT family N-acetyltransferase [Spirochaetaceae bacterium]|nr:GNAT family N-acetyltransferase [Spirochaetaceae bacterium]
MKYSIIPAKDISQDMITRWSEIQELSESLISPYFCHEYTEAVSAVRNDVYIGLLEDEGRIKGFFPFHKNSHGIARPVGLGLSDYHGIIAEPDVKWNVETFMHKCKIIRWEFDHLLAEQSEFSPYHTAVSDSPIIEVNKGIEYYVASLGKSERKQYKEVLRKRKKMEEQIGKLTYIAHTPQKNILQQMMNWKSEQCQRTGTVDIFSNKWCVDFINNIHSKKNPFFGGMLASLYAGERLAAVHFVMYSKQVWHSWFPAYNHDFEEFSPGSILLNEMISDASEKGIKYIDLGKGLSLYKKRVMTGGIPVAEGCIKIPSITNRTIDLKNRVESWSRQSILKPVLKFPGKIIKDMERKKKYE